MTTTQSIIPEFFSTVSTSPVAKWASNKVKEHDPETMELDGRKALVRTWFLQCKFPRHFKEFYGQWDMPNIGKQFTCTVRCLGGHYRGEKPTAIICFTEYASEDGNPLPV